METQNNYSFKIFRVLFKLYINGKKIEKINTEPIINYEYYFIDLDWLQNFKKKFNFKEVENFLNLYYNPEYLDKIDKIKKEKNSKKEEESSPLYEVFQNLLQKLKENNYTLNITESDFKSIKIITNKNIQKLNNNNEKGYGYLKNFAIINRKVKNELEEIGIISDIFPKSDIYIGSKNIIFETNNLDNKNCLQCIIYKDYDLFEEEFIIKYIDKKNINKEKGQIIKEKIETYFYKYNIKIEECEEQYIYNTKNEKIATVFNLNKEKKQQGQLNAQKYLNNYIGQKNNYLMQIELNEDSSYITKIISAPNNNLKADISLDDFYLKDNGLKNYGNSCYINVVLQCLIHIPQLAKYFMKKDSFRNNMPVSLAFNLLLHQFYIPKDYPNNINYNLDESLSLFCQVINLLNNNFSVILPNDAKDFLIYFIGKLHQELNESKENKQLNQVHNIINPKDPLYNFIQYFTKNYNSKISDLFNWTNQIIRTCSNCHAQILSYQTFPYLILDLEKTRKKKFENDINNYHLSKIGNEGWQNEYYESRENIPINLIDCIKYYGSYINTFNFYCPMCNKECQQNTINKIFTSPNNFIFILNRGKNNIYSVKMNYPPTIDLSKEIESIKCPTYYELIGVITHLGLSGPNGHFLAFCKNPKDGNWYKYNDDKVSPAENHNVHNEGVAYILFYSSKSESNK